MTMLSRFSCAVALLAVALVAQPALADPPGRVGRISLLSGSTTFRDLAAGEDFAAKVNWPVTTQNGIVTGEDGRAEIRIGSSAVRLDRDSELHFVQLDDEHIKLYLASGSATVRVRSRDAARDFELTTRQGRILLLEPGRYRLDADQARDSTAMSVFQGAARVDSAESSVPLRSGERVEVWDNGYPRVVQARADAFDDWSLGRDRRDEAARSARYVSPEMTGYEDLDEYGHWEQSGDYGPVWYPRTVASGWAPYRSGHWAWVAPWGWTWVDEAPWGFAPFHYGRWVTVGGVWAWAPGAVVARPVYAPALVAWVGRPGWNVSIGFGSGPAVGWFPLAPREVFYPGYRCSPAYVRNVNVAHVTNITQITNVNQQNIALTNVNYRHRHMPQAVTVVPADVVAKGRPVRHAMLREHDARTIAALPVAAAPSAVAPALAAPRPSERRRHQQPGAATPDGRTPLPGFAPSAGRPPQAGDDPAARGGPRTPAELPGSPAAGAGRPGMQAGTPAPGTDRRPGSAGPQPFERGRPQASNPDTAAPHGPRGRDEERRHPAAADPQARTERSPRVERDGPREGFPTPRREAMVMPAAPQTERIPASPTPPASPSPRVREEERRQQAAPDPSVRPERVPKLEREVFAPPPRQEQVPPFANVQRREQMHEQRRDPVQEQRREYRRPEPPAPQPVMQQPAQPRMEHRPPRIEAPAVQAPRPPMQQPVPTQMEHRPRNEARPEPRFDPRPPPPQQRMEPPAQRAQGGPPPKAEGGQPRHRRGPEGEGPGPGGPR
jgi:hypothetical protein